METLVRTKIKELLNMQPGQEVLAKGWVRTKRGNKQVKFIALNNAYIFPSVVEVGETTKLLFVNPVHPKTVADTVV